MTTVHESSYGLGPILPEDIEIFLSKSCQRMPALTRGQVQSGTTSIQLTAQLADLLRGHDSGAPANVGGLSVEEAEQLLAVARLGLTDLGTAS